MISFTCHILGLTVPGFWLGRKLRLPFLQALGGSFLIFETSLVFGAGFLSWARLLGNQRAYQATTTLFACGFALGLWFIARSVSRRSAPPSVSKLADIRNEPALTTTLGAVLATLVIGFVLDRMLSRSDTAHDLTLYKLTTMIACFGIIGAAALFAWHSSFSSKLDTSVKSFFHLPRPNSVTVAGSIIILATFATLMLWLALNAYPAVEDSLTIKLQKVVFAIQSNSFLPTDLTDDGRMFISPVYPALLQLFFIINDQKTHALLVFGFVNWAVCGLAIYGICRYIGASKTSFWLTLTFVLLSPMLIIQGTSEGDDILAATPFLLSLLFFLRWTSSNGRIDASFAGLGLGLSVGIKLFPLFYLPAVPVILLLAIYKFKIPFFIEWVRERAGTVSLMIASFIFALLPQAIANWVAFGNPLYVSPSALVTRNSPFSIECALRDTTGYLKQFLFSDLLRIVARVMIPPSAPIRQTYVSNVDRYNEYFATALPFDPTPACSAWDHFSVTNWYVSDNTFWFGVFGPLLLFACIFAVVTRKQSLVVRSLGLGFLVWLVAFAFSQKYIGWIGRYWSLPVLAASPVVAMILDQLLRRGDKKRVGLLLILPGVALTAMLGVVVLTTNYHRSLGRALRDGPRYNLFPAELRSVLNKAHSVNIQLIYGMDTYDYYLMLSPGAKILNKAPILDNSLNVALVRPYGILNNPFADPRIAVRMTKPFSHGFRFFGQVLGGFGFVNNTELIEHGETDPDSLFLLFQASVKQEGPALVGTISQIADPAIINNVRYRIGWREKTGEIANNGEWKRGPSAGFKIPANASTLVLQASFIGVEDDASTMEWPLNDNIPGIVAGPP